MAKSIRNVSLDEHATLVLSRVENVSGYIENIIKLRDREWQEALNEILDSIPASEVLKMCQQREDSVLFDRPQWRDQHARAWTLIHEWWAGNDYMKKVLMAKAKNK